MSDSINLKRIAKFKLSMPNGQVATLKGVAVTPLGNGWQREEETLSFWANPKGWKLLWAAVKCFVLRKELWPEEKTAKISVNLKRVEDESAEATR